MTVGIVRDIATLNRYESRKFRGDKERGRIANKNRMCAFLGLPQSTLDIWEKRYPDFPTPVYKSKKVQGVGFLYYYSTRQIEDFIAKRVDKRVSKYEDIIERVKAREGLSKYGAFLERVGVESEVK